MTNGASVNVTTIIDSGRFGAFRWLVAIWCFVLVTLDGFDSGLIGFVAPVIAREWHVAVPAFGPVFGVGLFGLMIGALASGPIADRVGRKFVVLISSIIFAVFALATSLAQSMDQLYWLRLFTGIGVGGLMPNSIALTAEYAPRKLRSTVVSLMFLGFPLGAGAGGFLGAALIPILGWKALFIGGGILPLVLLPAAIVMLPESIRFLVAHKNRPLQVAGLLNHLTGTSQYTGAELFTVSEDQTLHGFPVTHLVRDGRALNTSLLWLTFFCNLLVIYSLNSWLPMLLKDSGLSLATALQLAGVTPWAGIVSTIFLGPIVDRLGAPRVVTTLYVLASAFIFTIGLAGVNVPLLAVAIIGCGMCVIGGQSFINVLAAILYPTSIRSTGVGWALGVGRVGAIVGPVVGGWLLAAHITAQNLFFSISVPSLVAAAAMFVLGLRLRHGEGFARTDAVMTTH